MFGGKRQSMDSGNVFQANVVRSKDRKIIQKGTLETTPTSVVFRGEGSKTKLSWTLKSLRKIEADTDRLFMMDTGDVTCSLSEAGVIWFQMNNAKQIQNAVLHNMNVMIRSETPRNHRSMTSTTDSPDFQVATPTSIVSETSPPPPPMHWRLNTRTSMESTSSNVSPTNSRASLVQGDIFEVEKILGKDKKERGTLEVLDNEVIYVESETGECRRVVWSFKYIRRFGYEGDVFTIEVGRRAPGGAGLHNFKTPHPAELNAAVKSSSLSGGGTPPSPHGRSSYTPPSQRAFFSPPSSSHPPPHHAAPLPPPPSQPPLPVPPSPPQTPRNPHASRHLSPKLGNEQRSKVTSSGGFSRSDSLIRRAFSAMDLRPNVFEVRNISDEKKEVGQGTLEVTATDLIYIDARTSEKWRWPFKFLRKYGFEKNIFSFEAGRRCPGGQGLYAFSSDRASEIHETIVNSIRGRRKEEESQKNTSRASNHSEGVASAKGVPKSQSRYSFSEEQQIPPSLVKLTSKNHYNIDMGLHAQMQTRPLPAEPSEGDPFPPQSSAVDSVISPYPSRPSTSASESDSKVISPTPSLSTVSESPTSVPSPTPSSYAQDVPPMQLVKPVMESVKPQQPPVREHHYDVPGNYGANVKEGTKSKKKHSSSQKPKKADLPRVNEKRRLSKASIKNENGIEDERSLKESRSQSKFMSFLKKTKPKGGSIDVGNGPAVVGDSGVANVNGAGSRQVYVNVNIGPSQSMKKSASCDDILGSCEVDGAQVDMPSAVPRPQLVFSQTPPVQRRPGSNGHHQLEQLRNSGEESSSSSLVYQNLQDIKASGERECRHPAPPTSVSDSSTSVPSLSYQPHLYTNVEIRSEANAPPTPKGTMYTEIEIQEVSPARSASKSRKPSENTSPFSLNMHPSLQQAFLSTGLSPNPSAKRYRSQSLVPTPSQTDSQKDHRERSQSEAATEEELNEAAVLTTGSVQELRDDQKFEPVQYAPLDFDAMRAVAAIKRDHADVRKFEEILQRHDVREMEMEGKRR